MMDRQTIGVVIPFFNGSRWIQRALESVYSQSRLPNEVIIVNDGSDSNEANFLKDLSNKYDFKTLSQENRGQSSARNLGVTESESQFICFLDQDDYFLPNHIETLVGLADSSDSMFAFSYGDLYRVAEDGKVISKTCVNVKIQHPFKSVSDMLRNNMYILPSATLIKKSAFQAVGGFDEALQGYEDDDLFLRLSVAGFTNRFSPEPVSVWTLNSSSTSFTESMSVSRFTYCKKLWINHGERSDSPISGLTEILVSRFAHKFAEDVIRSALSNKEFFEDRKKRLVFISSVALKSRELTMMSKVKFIIPVIPILILGPFLLRLFLSQILWLSPALRAFRISSINIFLDRFSSGKKSITSSCGVLF